MVTMPGEAGDDDALVRALIAAGVNCMRINTADDDADVWRRMIANLARAKKETGMGWRMLMDLGGPKLGTSTMEPGPHVVHWRPRRDAFGATGNVASAPSARRTG
jgi:pyruvate kinase